MIFSIQNDIDAKELDAEQLRQEIKSSGILPGFDGFSVSGDVIDIPGVSADAESALSLLVKNHNPLLALKEAKKALIDEKTDSIIAQGFLFDGNRFSLSNEAQTNWLGLATLQSLFTFPIGITNSQDETYMLTQGNLIPFVATGSMAIAQAIGYGRMLKMMCNAATTKQELDAVVDPR